MKNVKDKVTWPKSAHELPVIKGRIQSSIECCCCCWVASVMSDSVRPHRWQPSRLPRPWDSLGENTGVGCHFLLQCMKVKSESEVAQSCRLLATPWTAAHQAPLSMGFSRQEYWSGVPLPSPKDRIHVLNLSLKLFPQVIWLRFMTKAQFLFLTCF